MEKAEWQLDKAVSRVIKKKKNDVLGEDSSECGRKGVKLRDLRKKFW